MLPYFELPAEDGERAVVIWLHGLGAEGADLEPVAEMLEMPGLRHVLPDAPVRSVTINHGMLMRAWYDISEGDFYRGSTDEAGLMESAYRVKQLAAECVRPGQPLLLGGFSQGGAVALAAGLGSIAGLAGILVLSSYVPMSIRKPDCVKPPIFMAHGDQDRVVFPEWTRSSRDWLEAVGFDVSWHEYPMGHAICQDEIRDMREWMESLLDRSSSG
jgi:phospholipase/carboxylesterase